MSDQANAVALQQDALPINDESPQPIELEIPKEGGEVEETKVEEKPRQKPGRPPANLIISGLKTEKSELLTANDRLIQELELERRKNQDLEKKANESTFQQMALHEGRLKAEAENARKAYEDAFNAQDPKKLAEATGALAKAEAGLNDVEGWKARNKPEERKQEVEQPRQQQQQPVPVDPSTQQWMEENQWFSPNVAGRPNPEFNKTMHLTAVAYASRLEDQYRAENRIKDIAGPEYWEKINQYMSEQFPDNFEVEEQEQRPKTHVAAVGRTTATTAKSTSEKVSLTAQERSFVDQMRGSGAMLYPKGHKDFGQRMTPTDSYVSYWRQKKADTNQRSN